MNRTRTRRWTRVRRTRAQWRAIFAKLRRSAAGRYLAGQVRDPEVQQAVRDVAVLYGTYKALQKLPDWSATTRARVRRFFGTIEDYEDIVRQMLAPRGKQYGAQRLGRGLRALFVFPKRRAQVLWRAARPALKSLAKGLGSSLR